MAKKSGEENNTKGKAPDIEQESKSSSEHRASDMGNQAKEAVEKVYQLARNVQRDTLAYVVLVLGLVLLFFRPDWGGALIGVVFGTYFSNELITRITGFRQLMDSEGQAKTIALGGFILALLIMVPTLVLGALAAVGVVALMTRKPA